jgi:hypothetical protein
MMNAVAGIVIAAFAVLYNKSPVLLFAMFERQRSETNNAMALPFSFYAVIGLQLTAANQYKPHLLLFCLTSLFHLISQCEVQLKLNEMKIFQCSSPETKQNFISILFQNVIPALRSVWTERHQNASLVNNV